MIMNMYINTKISNLEKGFLKGLDFLIKKKFYLFIITNQAGIAKNVFKERDFLNYIKPYKNSLQKIYILMKSSFVLTILKQKIKKYKKITSLRKPGNKMIKKI